MYTRCIGFWRLAVLETCHLALRLATRGFHFSYP